MCPKRLDIINRIFDKLDFDRDNIITLTDLKFWYGESAKMHQKYLKNEWTVDEVCQLINIVIKYNKKCAFFKVLEQTLHCFEIPGSCIRF